MALQVPGLFTRTIPAPVMPRNTSSDMSRSRRGSIGATVEVTAGSLIAFGPNSLVAGGGAVVLMWLWLLQLPHNCAGDCKRQVQGSSPVWTGAISVLSYGQPSGTPAWKARDPANTPGIEVADVTTRDPDVLRSGFFCLRRAGGRADRYDH